MATTMPTWLTGLLVTVWIARSAIERPRNSQMSPVEAVATASSRLSTARNLRADEGPLEARRAGRSRRRGRDGRDRRAPAAGARGVRPGGAAGQAPQAPCGGGRGRARQGGPG